ncbi:hypothetical protein [Colwellia sp. 20A7]|uniref:hypothetical protein n=1 Tax=Colwellia sp. 20A7 TaxID=2689569 RepID=UPI00135A4396|nr:hypothetical protein [Colwellia sp. 20A7]
MFEIITTIANVGALAVIGFIYIAYIKNLRSMNGIKDTQIKVAEQNIKLWKDKALDLERKSPEFIEKQLSERIKIREEEITRLAHDSEEHSEKISTKNSEIEKLQESLNKAHEYRKSVFVYDRDERDFIEIPHSELDCKTVGLICVDSASLMIGDPWYKMMNEEQEKEEFPVQSSMYKVVETGELFCTNFDDPVYDMELLGLDPELTPQQMLSMGLITKELYTGALPAIKTSYINKTECDSEYRKIRHSSFLNGRLGAAISVSLEGDGVYSVSLESYKGSIQRIIIDV